MKAQALKVNGQAIEIPTHVDLVDGLENFVASKINDYDSSTVVTRINGLSAVYLAINGKAVSAIESDSSTTAAKAYADNDGNTISTTYYKKTDTVEKALKDSQDNIIYQTYATKNGTIANAQYATTAGAANTANTASTASTATYASSAGAANVATLDSKGNAIDGYFKSVSVSGGNMTFTKGDGSTQQVAAGSSGSKVFFGMCTTASTSSTKQVTVDGDIDYTDGNILFVWFTNAFVTVSDMTPLLDINGGGGNHMIFYRGSEAGNLCQAKDIVAFVCRGGHWHVISGVPYGTSS